MKKLSRINENNFKSMCRVYAWEAAMEYIPVHVHITQWHIAVPDKLQQRWHDQAAEKFKLTRISWLPAAVHKRKHAELKQGEVVSQCGGEHDGCV